MDESVSTKIKLEILTPYTKEYEGMHQMVLIPSQNGELGFLSRHVPIVVIINYGKVKLYENDLKINEIFVSNGLGIFENEKLSLMVDFSDKISEVNIKEINEKVSSLLKKREGDALDESNTNTSNPDFELNYYQELLKHING